MPKMGESVMECTVISVLKKVGERVEADDSVLEVATDKVDTEVPAPFSGVVREILVKEGDVVAIGSVVMRLETATNGQAASTEIPVSEAIEAEMAALVPQFNALVPQVATPAVVESQNEQSTRFYSPLVQTIAKTEGISIAELETITGSGTENRVTKNDILNYLKTRTNTPQSKATQPLSHSATHSIIQSFTHSHGPHEARDCRANVGIATHFGTRYVVCGNRHDQRRPLAQPQQRRI